MRKLALITLLYIIIINNIALASNTLTISAIVGNSNHTPIITSIIPNSDPIYLDNSTDINLVKQNYTIKFRDDERDEVTYTITTEENGGVVNPSSGIILTNNYDINNEAYIFFEYISPTLEIGAKTITLTISDGPNVTVKTINVYIY